MNQALPCCQKLGKPEPRYPYRVLLPSGNLAQLQSPYRDLAGEIRLRGVEEQRWSDDGGPS